MEVNSYLRPLFCFIAFLSLILIGFFFLFNLEFIRFGVRLLLMAVIKVFEIRSK